LTGSSNHYSLPEKPYPSFSNIFVNLTMPSPQIERILAAIVKEWEKVK